MPQFEADNPALVRIRTERGLASKLAEKCGITRNAVWMWKRVPPEHAITVARALRMRVHMVCPSVFPAPRKEKKQKSSTHN